MTRPLIRAIAIAMQSELAVLFWGPSGIGKSSVMGALARAIGAHAVEPIYCSTREATDFSGLPMLIDGVVRFVPPFFATETAALAQKHKLIVLPIEEINRTSPMVQNAALGFVLGGRVGELKLPGNVLIISAANPPASHNNANPLDSGLSNRFVHFEFEADLEEWIEGTTHGWEELTVPILPEGWFENYRVAASEPFNEFLRSNDGAFLQEPTSFESGMRGWPSPRSWDSAKRLWAAAYSVNASVGVLQLLLTAAVGEGASAEMWEHFTRHNLPNPEELFANPDSFEVPTESHRVYLILDNLTQLLKRDATQAKFTALWKIVLRVYDSGQEDQAIAVGQTLSEVGRAKSLSAPREVTRLAQFRRSLG